MENEIKDIKEMAERNYELILKNTTSINNNLERINQNSYVLEILKDYKKDSRRLFIILIIILCMWFATIGYLVYILNDVGTIQETITQDNQSGYNNYIGNDGEIVNGKADN